METLRTKRYRGGNVRPGLRKPISLRDNVIVLSIISRDTITAMLPCEQFGRGAKFRVAIVGGGVAGACIADTLSEKHPGWEVTLFEKGRHVAQGEVGVRQAERSERREQNRLP